nr:MAG TPA: replication regulatory protein [Caudoviricetes sp.]
MDKIIIHKVHNKPVGKSGGSVWVSKEVSEQLDSIALETGIAKQRITDYLLKRALELVEVADSEI